LAPSSPPSLTAQRPGQAALPQASPGQRLPSCEHYNPRPPQQPPAPTPASSPPGRPSTTAPTPIGCDLLKNRPLGRRPRTTGKEARLYNEKLFRQCVLVGQVRTAGRAGRQARIAQPARCNPEPGLLHTVALFAGETE
jgi:hypothetical protein